MRWAASAVAALALMVTPAGAAKGQRAFDRHAARAGDVIRVGVDVPVATSSPWTSHAVVRVSVYLLPLDASPRWWPTYTGVGFAPGPPLKLPGVVALGRFDVARGQETRLRVRTPQVASGQYVLGYWASGVRWTSALPNLRTDPYGVLRVNR
jgi:hypothetical protein